MLDMTDIHKINCFNCLTVVSFYTVLRIPGMALFGCSYLLLESDVDFLLPLSLSAFGLSMTCYNNGCMIINLHLELDRD